MKTPTNLICLFLIYLITLINAIAQTANNNTTITREQFLNYFPSCFNDLLYYPSTEAVYILPSHEKDKKMQENFIQFCKDELFVKFILPGLNIKVVSDTEALKMDLTNANIFAFGTKKGNSWISDFFLKAKDFPIQIKDTTIIADTIYSGANQTLCATWYNLVNYKHSVFIYVPLDLNSISSYTSLSRLTQFAVLKDNNATVFGKYLLKDNKLECFNSEKLGSLSKDSTGTVLYQRPMWPEDKEYRKVDSTNNLYYPPTLEELSDVKLTDNEIKTDTIRIEDINENFDNIQDLSWLKPISEKYKIIAIGEGPHHMKYATYFLNRILFALNTFDYFPVFVCELPFSWGAYINYYLEISDDIEAEKFCDTVFTKLGIPKRFKPIRRWNQAHPDKKITVACCDMEHNLKEAIIYTLNPYLKKIAPNISLDYSKKDTFQSYLASAQSILLNANNVNITGQYPFQTTSYMSAVFENIKSSVFVIKSKKFMKERYKVIIRNDTSNQFIGKFVKSSKCIFYGGDKHFQILYRIKVPMQETDGTFLARNFEPTRNKMYVIRLSTLSCGIEDSVRRIKPVLGIDAEQEIIDLYKKGKCNYNDKFINRNSYLEGIWKYFYKLNFKYPGYAFLVKSMDLKNAEKLGYSGPEVWKIALDAAYIIDYNTTIVIPYSPFGFY